MLSCKALYRVHPLTPRRNCWGGTITTAEELRHREVKELAQSHRARSRDLNPGSPTLASKLLTMKLCYLHYDHFFVAGNKCLFSLRTGRSCESFFLSDSFHVFKRIGSLPVLTACPSHRGPIPPWGESMMPWYRQTWTTTIAHVNPHQCLRHQHYLP